MLDLRKPFEFYVGLTPSLPRRNRNPAENQAVADGVIKLEALAQQHDRQHRAEDRNEMDERRGAVGADELDAAVEEQVAEQRREDADEGEAESTLGIEHHRSPAHDFEDDERNEKHRAAAHPDDEKRQRMDRRPLAQHGHVEAVEHQRDHEPDVALIERNAEQDRETAVADDDDDAAERDADATGLP